MKTLLVLVALIGCLPGTIWMDYAGSAFDSPLLLQNGAGSGAGLGLKFLNRFRNRYQTYDKEEETYNKEDSYNKEDRESEKDYNNDDYQKQNYKKDKDYQQTRYQKNDYQESDYKMDKGHQKQGYNKMDQINKYANGKPSVEYKRPKSPYIRQKVYKKHKKYQPAYVYSQYVRPDYSKDNNSYKKYSNARPVYRTKGDYREDKMSDTYQSQGSQAYEEQSDESSRDKGRYGGYKSAQKPDSKVRYNSRYETDSVNDQQNKYKGDTYQRYTTKYDDDSYWYL